MNRFEDLLHNKHTAVRSICHHATGDNKFPSTFVPAALRIGYLKAYIKQPK
jgi:hypothetical protein